MARMKITEKINLLFDYAVAHPEGFTYVDIERDFGWERIKFFEVVNRCRKVLASDDINLVCQPENGRAPWTYRLVGNLEGTRWWAVNRMGDAEKRLATMLSIAQSTVQATDGRTHDGKRARIIRKGLSRLLEDLSDLRVDGAA